ncbi:IkappaB kinase complex, IKAP component [Parathielavia appendiculata]|uniref:Elongator complex protein 1 n=1 Tax=Parathielavia appendiculata TaxID=2587402 RepID=A0AAN6TYA0_9PEZI|nr:IkappaB kinase complex, IKAP component [Parathielavia appendiculata]
MRNLRNIGHGVCRIPNSSSAPATAPPVSALCWDVARDEVIIACGPAAGDARIELLRVAKHVHSPSPSQLQSTSIAIWDASNPNPDGEADAIRDIHYFSDTLTTCVIMAGGDIVTVTENDEATAVQGEAHVEIVGTLSPSIAAARWSPDEELLVIATGDAKLLFMSRSFDVIAGVGLSAEDLKLSRHVSVGWGKKETQFQGRGARAKALRDPTIPEKVDEGTPSSHDDGRCTVSWRGDGAFVAVNFLQEGVRRVIRVYNRDGELDSVSEPVDGLEGSLSWRPEGNLIAGVQRLPDRVDVAFFERNGLRHGQFTLRTPVGEPDVEDIALEWNSDSTVLAVILKDRIQLWTMGNYHWYLKQEILCAQLDDPTPQYQRPLFSWHAEKSLLLAAATRAKVLVNEYALTVSRGPTRAPHDYGVVAVIDGQVIKYTPFRTCNVPPPMAMCELEVESPVIDVVFSTDCTSMAVLHRVGVSFFALEANSSRLPRPRFVALAALGKAGPQTYEESLLQIAFSGPSEVQVLQMADDLELLRYDFSLETSKWLRTDTSVVATIFSPGSDGLEGVVAQHVSGKLSSIANGESSPLPVHFPTFLPWTSCVVHNDEFLGFGLSRNGHLYANSRQLTKNCTSFLVTDNHLIFTTSNHLVKFVHLAPEQDLDVPPDDPEKDERCRSIERGGRLVTAIPSKMSLVLQMPRGNLETIYPRAMVLAGIRRLVEQKDYGSAFATCRTQRVDMNILFDHRPEQFLDNVGLFLEQVKDPANIDLFLSTLKEEDVTQTMYRDTKMTAGQPPSDPKPAAKPGKINTICDAVLQKLRIQKKGNLQNIITAHVCKNPPALDDGLRVVAELMQEDEALADRAVEHICFLADVNKLYDHALGLYNLDLTLLVAQQSQCDPREYLPFVQELHKMPMLKRQFTIDDKLEHWEKALDHLKALNNFEDVKNYVVKHKLYQYALGLYRHEEQHHQAITDLFAAYLKSTSQFKEAGLAYESLGNYPDATDCYLKAGATCWRECLYAAQQQSPPLSNAKLSEIATALADALREAKDYAAAATIHLDYLSSVESSIQHLCKGYLFADALRLVALHNRPDLLPTVIDAGLAEVFSSSTEFLADCKEQLKAQVPRIAELRRKAIEDPLAFYEGENPLGARAAAGGAEIPDDVSIAASSRISTSASLFTRYTGKAGSVGTVGSNVSRATSKNRRREEKKRARGRKGTVYEEEYLVNSVRRLVERVEAAKPEVERLVFGLVRRGMQERARAVEELMGQVVEGCRKAVDEVWPAGQREEEEATRDPEAEGYRPGGGDGVLYDSLEAMRSRQTPPVVGGFERLSLLGKGRSG